MVTSGQLCSGPFRALSCPRFFKVYCIFSLVAGFVRFLFEGLVSLVALVDVELVTGLWLELGVKG